MNKLSKTSEVGITLVKHYIKDLSFENPQPIKENTAENNNNNNISASINFLYEPYENNFFSIILKYSCECSSKNNVKNLFLLELEYFGFFKIVDKKLDKQVELTKRGAQLILPFVKSIVEDISARGGSIPLTFENIHFDLIKI